MKPRIQCVRTHSNPDSIASDDRRPGRSIRLSGCLARCLESPRERQTRGSRWVQAPRRCPCRKRLEELPTGELPDQAVADHAREGDTAEVVRRALNRLPQRMRTTVMLRYFEDMTEPEIAAALGISLGTVKSTMSRAVAKLRIDAELGEDSGA